MDFADLPLEIIPFISQHLLRPQHLAQACLINKNFYSYTVPFLYERIAIFAWHKNGKKKATRLFWTLANCPQLSRYVLRLELRDFPKAISRESALELTKTCVQAIDNCVNLQSCTWTREGSLKEDILEALARCPHLEVLEINGRHTHNYDPALLLEFSRLRKIAFIMPSSDVMQQLPSCVQRNRTTLQALTIICKFTSVVTDASLKAMAPALSSLEHIHIAGCPKVTHHGIIEILSANASGVRDLALEGVSPSFVGVSFRS
ncbi:hypothetical protein M0805_004442 [Coniferiporia weirii]|nr:hypothetical protein M0805_004442 [Coniferiporia weirii]